MIQSASNAKGFTIKVNAYSKTYLPDILDLKDKTIKFIDIVSGSGVINKDLNENTISTNLLGCYINVMEQGTQNLFIKGVSLNMLNPFYRRGERELINKKIDMINSYIENDTNTSKNIYVVVWWDDPDISNGYNEIENENIDFVEVSQFDSLTNKCYFPDNRTLIGKQISFFNFNLNGSFVTPTMNTNVDGSDMESCFVTLIKNNYKFVENVPLSLFTTYMMYNVVKLQNVVFDLQNSYISFPQSIASNINGKVFFVNVEYKQ